MMPVPTLFVLGASCYLTVPYNLFYYGLSFGSTLGSKYFVYVIAPSQSGITLTYYVVFLRPFQGFPPGPTISTFSGLDVFCTFFALELRERDFLFEEIVIGSGCSVGKTWRSALVEKDNCS